MDYCIITLYVKSWVLIMGLNGVLSGYTTSMDISDPQVDGGSTDPRILGCHRYNINSHIATIINNVK